MTINKEKIAELARDTHNKMLDVNVLNSKLQRDKLPETAAELAVAQVEYKRAKKILDNFMAQEWNKTLRGIGQPMKAPNQIRLKPGIGYGSLLQPSMRTFIIEGSPWSYPSTRLAEYKRIRAWLDRAIQYTEEQSSKESE